MKYKAYPKYKDSGVDWLGDIPEHWDVELARRFVISHKQGYYSSDPYVNEGIKLLRISDFVGDGRMSTTQCPFVEEREELLQYLLIEGDFVFARTGGAGSFALIEELNERLVFAAYLIRFRFNKKKFFLPFLRFFFLSASFQFGIARSIHGGVNQNVHAEDIKNQFCINLPLPEQITIAKFLHHETHKIDALLKKKRALIEKLKEKHTALISRTVTRGLPPEAARAAGLDPHPKLKPSGVEWLGDVPEHWEIKKGRHLGILLGSVSPSEEKYTDNENGVAFAKVDDLNHIDSSFFLLNTTNRIEGYAASHRKLILFPKRGAAIFTNKVAIAEGNFLFDSNIMGWEIIPFNETKYVAYCLIARRLDDLADVSTVPQINNKHIYPALFPRPPIKEQCLIVDFLEDATHKIDQLITKVEAAIDRLQEYRTALITAAVTGKIDVRETEA